MTDVDQPTLLDRFRAAGEAAGSTVHELADWSDVAALAAQRAGGGRVVVAPSLARAAPDLLAALRDPLVPDRADPVGQVADADVGVVAGELGIAESGSVLVADHDLVDRTVSMLSRTLIQVVVEDRLLPALEDAAAWLSTRGPGPGFAALVTGPSRSADIERSLTVGVQGPSVVHVVVLRSDAA